MTLMSAASCCLKANEHESYSLQCKLLEAIACYFVLQAGVFVPNRNVSPRGQRPLSPREHPAAAPSPQGQSAHIPIPASQFVSYCLLILNRGLTASCCAHSVQLHATAFSSDLRCYSFVVRLEIRTEASSCNVNSATQAEHYMSVQWQSGSGWYCVLQRGCPQHPQQRHPLAGATWSRSPPGLPGRRAAPPPAETLPHPPETAGQMAMLQTEHRNN